MRHERSDHSEASRLCGPGIPGKGARILPTLKRAGSGTDATIVILDSNVMLAFGAVGGLCTLLILQMAALQVKSERTLHDLKIRVNQLRQQRLEYLKAFPSAREAMINGSKNSSIM